MDPEPKPNRIAEMALELFGAKAAHEFLREAWEHASPEAKRQIADALVARVMASLQSKDDWSWREIVQGAVVRSAQGALNALASENAEQIAAAARREWERCWQAKVKDICLIELERAVEKIQREFWPRVPKEKR